MIGLLARLRLLIPLLIVVAIIAVIIYLVVSWRRSPVRAKEVLILVFTWFCSFVAIFFGVVFHYALTESNGSVMELAGATAVLAIIGLIITRICKLVFNKNHPHYKDSPTVTAKVVRRFPWDSFRKNNR